MERELQVYCKTHLNLNFLIHFCKPAVHSRGGGGGGDSNIKKVGMLVKNFEIDP